MGKTSSRTRRFSIACPSSKVLQMRRSAEDSSPRHSTWASPPLGPCWAKFEKLDLSGQVTAFGSQPSVLRPLQRPAEWRPASTVHFKTDFDLPTKCRESWKMDPSTWSAHARASTAVASVWTHTGAQLVQEVSDAMRLASHPVYLFGLDAATVLDGNIQQGWSFAQRIHTDARYRPFRVRTPPTSPAVDAHRPQGTSRLQGQTGQVLLHRHSGIYSRQGHERPVGGRSPRPQARQNDPRPPRLANSAASFHSHGRRLRLPHHQVGPHQSLFRKGESLSTRDYRPRLNCAEGRGETSSEAGTIERVAGHATQRGPRLGTETVTDLEYYEWCQNARAEIMLWLLDIVRELILGSLHAS